MTDKKISELTQFTTPTDNDIFVAVDGSETKKILFSDLKTSLNFTTFVDNETLTGTINGVNKVFTLNNAPDPAVSLQIFLNGAFQTAGGEDYSLVGLTITFINAPFTGSVLQGYYRY